MSDNTEFSDGFSAGYATGYRACKDRHNPQWIPCSERMPEKGQKCLVCDKGAIAIDTFIGNGKPYDWKWYMRDYEAWIPLPEPYKEEPKKCDTCQHEKEPWSMQCHRCDNYNLWEGKR